MTECEMLLNADRATKEHFEHRYIHTEYRIRDPHDIWLGIPCMGEMSGVTVWHWDNDVTRLTRLDETDTTRSSTKLRLP